MRYRYPLYPKTYMQGNSNLCIHMHTRTDIHRAMKHNVIDHLQLGCAPAKQVRVDPRDLERHTHQVTAENLRGGACVSKDAQRRQASERVKEAHEGSSRGMGANTKPPKNANGVSELSKGNETHVR